MTRNICYAEPNWLIKQLVTEYGYPSTHGQHKPVRFAKGITKLGNSENSTTTPALKRKDLGGEHDTSEAQNFDRRRGASGHL